MHDDSQVSRPGFEHTVEGVDVIDVTFDMLERCTVHCLRGPSGRAATIDTKVDGRTRCFKIPLSRSEGEAIASVRKELGPERDGVVCGYLDLSVEDRAAARAAEVVLRAGARYRIPIDDSVAEIVDAMFSDPSTLADSRVSRRGTKGSRPDAERGDITYGMLTRCAVHSFGGDPSTVALICVDDEFWDIDLTPIELRAIDAFMSPGDNHSYSRKQAAAIILQQVGKAGVPLVEAGT